MTDDLELKQLDGFIGTQAYHKDALFQFANLTDGIIYVMENGYSWFITDMLAVIKMKPEIRKQEFLVVKLKVYNDKTAQAIITDENRKILYTQNYEWTNAKKDLNLFFTDNVLMLSSEY